MQKITPFLWFDTQAEAAANFYVSIFNNSRIVRIARYGDAGPGPKGSVMIVEFELEGQKFIALNGGPQYSFTKAISLYVDCADQAEVDRLWVRLLDGGGEENACGWLTDKFGLAWQIIPKTMIDLLNDADAAKAQRVMRAMMEMVKIDVAAIEAAAAG